MQNVIHVGDADFMSAVMDRSMSTPVLVDFWAEWCAPCKQLAPILDRLAEEFDGAFVLAKVDTDKAPQVAQAMRIQSIPTVMLFKDGQPVDGFAGVQPESVIRELLARHVPTEAGLLAEAGDRIASAGGEDAEAAFRRSLEADPKQPAALLGLARILALRGEVGEARKLLDDIRPGAEEGRASERLLEALDFWALLGGATLEAPAEGEARADLDQRLADAARTAGAREFEPALGALYELLIEDRDYRDAIARRAMVSIFGFVGEDSDVTRTWQRRMANLLY
jgi:putative thioredoxin